MWRVLPSLRTLTALVILTGAVMLGAAQNIVFIRSLGTDHESTLVWVGLAVLSAALKIAVPTTPAWYRNVFLLSAFACALVFDLFCAIGHGALTRGVKLEAHTAALAHGAVLAATVSRLEKELDAAKQVDAPPRPSAMLRAHLDSLRASSGCAKDETWKQCPIILGPLKAELASVTGLEDRVLEAKQRRAILVHALDKARESLSAYAAPAHPDPQAAWIAATFGLSERFAASWQTLLGMAILELGVIAGAIMVERGQASSPAPLAPRGPSAPAPRTPRTPGAGAQHALGTLRAVASGQTAAVGLTVASGTVSGSQGAFALACGCSQPTMGRWLQELSTAGTVQVRRQGRVTTVKVA